MVGEFPELQGLMGGYYATKEGLDPQVAAAIRDHYKPVGQGDDVPTDPVTVAVSLADKLDTLVSFFVTGNQPTGSKDPFALRRMALALIRLIITNDLRLPLLVVINRFLKFEIARDQYHWNELYEAPDGSSVFRFDEAGQWNNDFDLNRSENEISVGVHWDPVIRWPLAEFKIEYLIEYIRLSFDTSQVVAFVADRLKVQQREAGVRHDLIDAVFALGGEDDLVRLLARVHALQAFVETDEGGNLLAGYKRAANILKKEKPSPLEGRGGSRAAAGGEGHAPTSVQAPLPSTPDGVSSLSPQGERAFGLEPAEAALIAALDAAEPAAADAIAREDFAAAMIALASLRGPIDRFFDDVTVNDADPAKREHRLALLARIRAAVHSVADFSKIEG
ncbi:glycine--tRNA ligase subunit beta, partial [Blastomonas sp.]|uniref:glycine--tRNA ligase subunit beta n=1 Tax=Blastomonas sp. TaxID=1909299 RepID=UPI00359305E6